MSHPTRFILPIVVVAIALASPPPGASAATPIVGDQLLVGVGASAAGARANAIGPYSSAAGNHSLAAGHGAASNSTHSIAMGYNAKTFHPPSSTGHHGNAAVAIGNRAETHYWHAFALGLETRAYGPSSYALGIRATALGSHSFALGGGYADFVHTPGDPIDVEAQRAARQTIAAGRSSYALGWGAKTTEDAHYSLALGLWAFAGSPYSLAAGWEAESAANHSFAIGPRAYAGGRTSVAIGHEAETYGVGSTAVGRGLVTGSLWEHVAGSFNVDDPAADPDSWVATDAIFTVGNGTNAANPSNALRILKDGTVLITASGDIDPGIFTEGASVNP